MYIYTYIYIHTYTYIYHLSRYVNVLASYIYLKHFVLQIFRSFSVASSVQVTLQFYFHVLQHRHIVIKLTKLKRQNVN